MGNIRFKTNIMKRGNSLIITLRRGDFDNADSLDKFCENTRLKVDLEVIENE